MRNTPEIARWYAIKWLLDEGSILKEDDSLFIYGEFVATLDKKGVTDEEIEKYRQLKLKEKYG
jgi:hypothetical protein